MNKLKSRLANVQVQLIGASGLLSKGEPFLNSKIQNANKLVGEVLKACDSIKTKEIEPEISQKKRRKKEQSYSYLTPHEVIIHRNEPATYNLLCRNYSEIRNRKNEVIERTCIIGMDMCYCSKKCAYATNNVCSNKG